MGARNPSKIGKTPDAAQSPLNRQLTRLTPCQSLSSNAPSVAVARDLFYF